MHLENNRGLCIKSVQKREFVLGAEKEKPITERISVKYA